MAHSLANISGAGLAGHREPGVAVAARQRVGALLVLDAPVRFELRQASRRRRRDWTSRITSPGASTRHSPPSGWRKARLGVASTVMPRACMAGIVPRPLKPRRGSGDRSAMPSAAQAAAPRPRVSAIAASPTSRHAAPAALRGGGAAASGAQMRQDRSCSHSSSHFLALVFGIVERRRHRLGLRP